MGFRFKLEKENLAFFWFECVIGIGLPEESEDYLSLKLFTAYSVPEITLLIDYDFLSFINYFKMSDSNRTLNIYGLRSSIKKKLIYLLI